jgi:hypothetical protein
MKIAIVSTLLALLVGCQATGPQGSVWVANESRDEFTDVVTKMVTTGEGLSGTSLMTRSFRYYPFAGKQNGEVYFGIRSGGQHRMPVGTVQLRVDDKQAWTISPIETPVSLAPSMPTMSMTDGLDAKTADTVQRAQSQAMEATTKMMSPYTAATGEKAKSIIKEMLSGKVLRYRIVGMNQAGSTTGEVVIDKSFADSLATIGIDLDAR